MAAQVVDELDRQPLRSSQVLVAPAHEDDDRVEQLSTCVGEAMLALRPRAGPARLSDQPHLRRRLLLESPRERVAVWGHPAVGEQYEPEPVLRHPRRQRRPRRPGEHVEGRAAGNRSEHVPSLS